MLQSDFSKRPRSRNGSRGLMRGELDGWGLSESGCCAGSVLFVKDKSHCRQLQTRRVEGDTKTLSNFKMLVIIDCVQFP